MSLSDRASEDMSQALTVTHELISETSRRIREHMEIFFNLADSIVRSIFVLTGC